jgi:hypothetical protein
MQARTWKLLGVAGLAGVTATGVVVARRRRAQQEYDPDELRAKLHARLAEVPREGAAGGSGPAAGGFGPAAGGPGQAAGGPGPGELPVP